MPWVRLDDRFPSHRKVALLSDRAFRLYISALCWASENLTEGHITDRELPLVARVRGLKSVATELVDARLWDRVEGGYAIHDYLEYNPDRARVQADREANAARQRAFRERKRAERDAKKKEPEESARNAPRNGVTGNASGVENDASATRRRHDGDTNSSVERADSAEEAQVNAIRNGVSNGPPSRPVLPSPSEKEKEDRKLATRATPNAPSHIGDRPRIPPNCQPLIDALGTHGLVGIGWELNSTDWIVIEALIRRCGIPALVASALASAQGARSRPRSGAYFLPAWRSLPDAPQAPDTFHSGEPPAGNVVPLPATHRPSTTDARVQQAIDVGRRLQAAADAARSQEHP